MRRERLDVLQPDRGVVGEQRPPLVRRGGVDRCHGERVVLGVVVVQHEQAVLALDHRVLDRVLDPLTTRGDHPELAGGVGGVEDRVLAGGLGARGADQEPVAAGAPDPGPEPLVGLVVHHHVLGDRGPQHVPPHLVRTPGLVDGGVEERRALQVPGRAAQGVRHLVGQQLAGPEVLDPQQEALVADRVGAEGQQVPVRADRDPSEREEVVPLGELVGVDEDLLAGDLDVGGEPRRGPVVGPVDGAAAARAVLLVLVGAAVVPPVAHPVGHRQVRLLGAGPDLLEDRLAQAGEVGGAGLGPGVLGLQVGHRLRGVLVAQPLVVVDERVAVVGALGRDAPCGRRSGRRLVLGHARSLRLEP